MTTNRFYATRDSYQIPASIVTGGGSIGLGRGVDMTDPQNPLLVPQVRSFFDHPILTAAVSEEAYELSEKFVQDTFSLLQSDSEESEARALNAYFRASYGLSSFNAALSMAQSRRSDSHSAYVVLTHREPGPDMSSGAWQIREDLRPMAEDIQDDETAFNQFRREFGTHYVYAVTYGLTVAIRGTLRSANEQERLGLGAALQVGFGRFQAQGGFDAKMEAKLKSSNLELSSEIYCGGIVPARPLVMSSFDQIAELLRDIRQGTVRFKLCPVEVTLASYWSRLDPARLPRCRSLLDPVKYGTEFWPPRGSFGIPAGTIIAWWPTRAHVEHADDPQRAVIRPPEGWALCDGQEGRPDLRGRFVRGAQDLNALGKRDGVESHNHPLILNSGTVAAVAGLVKAKTQAVVRGELGQANNLPPFLQLVYIIKLDETH